MWQQLKVVNFWGEVDQSTSDIRKENVDVFDMHKKIKSVESYIRVIGENVKLFEGVRKYENYRFDVIFKYFSCFLKAADLLHTLSLQVVGDHQLKVPAIIQ